MMQAPQASDPLAELNDIHTPESVALWPLDWGWWVVIVLTLTLTLVLALWLYRRYRFYQARRDSLTALQQLSASQPDWPAAMNALLKRTALSYFDERQVASLHGPAWTAFLYSTLRDKHQRRFADGLTALNNALYQKGHAEADFATCQAASLGWVRYARLRTRPDYEVAQGGTQHV